MYLHAWPFVLHLTLFVRAHLLIPQISIHPRYLEVIFLAYHRLQTFFYIFLGIIGLKKGGTLFPTRRR